MKDTGRISWILYSYPDESRYITMGFSCGEGLSLFHDREARLYRVNRALGPVFLQALEAGNPGRFLLASERCLTAVTLRVPKGGVAAGIRELTERVCHADISEAMFIRSKWITLERFRTHFRDPVYRSMQKLYEFTDQGKAFQLQSFLTELTHMTYEEFLAGKTLLFREQNARLTITGGAEPPESQEDRTVYSSFLSEQTDLWPVFMLRGEAVPEDVCLILSGESAKQVYGVYFGFPEEINQFDRLLYLLIASERISEDEVFLHLDDADASLIFAGNEVSGRREALQKELTEDGFSECRRRAVLRMIRALKQAPDVWNLYVLSGMQNRVDLCEAIEALSEMSFESYRNTVQQFSVDIREAQVFVR